jgi:hypothetical protein
LSGANLFLVDSVASDPRFDHPVEVPDGFPGYVLPVPHPEGGQLYLKLRDDPSVVNEVTLAAEKLPPSPGETPRHATRAAYHEGEAAPAPAVTDPAAGSQKAGAPQEPAPDGGTKPATQPSTSQQPSQPANPQSGTGQPAQPQQTQGAAGQPAQSWQHPAASPGSPQQP